MNQEEEVAQSIANSPEFFGKYFLNWHAHEAQAIWLENSHLPQNYCRTGNRWGKTESIAIKHLWKCIIKDRNPKLYDYNEPYYSVNSALSLDQAQLALHKAWQIVHREENTEFRKCFIGRRVGTPFPRIEFNNGSVWSARSTSRKGRYLEGYDFDYVSNDEGAFDPDFGYIVDEVLSIRLIDRGGVFDAISTGKRGSEFNKRFELAKTDKKKFAFQGKTTDNPYLDKKALRNVMLGLDKGLILERIMGGVRPSDGLITLPVIMAAQKIASGITPRRIGRRYSTGWDLAREGNYVVGVTMDVTKQPYQLVAWEMFNKHDFGEEENESYWAGVIARIKRRHEIYGGQTFIDATGIGSVVLDIGGLNRLGAEAIVFSSSVLKELIGCLELAFGRGLIGVPHLHKLLFDGSTWTFADELEQVSNKLSGLDTATALALALWGVRLELATNFVPIINTRIGRVPKK